jgi:hypothetical protein
VPDHVCEMWIGGKCFAAEGVPGISVKSVGIFHTTRINIL